MKALHHHLPIAAHKVDRMSLMRPTRTDAVLSISKKAINKAVVQIFDSSLRASHVTFCHRASRQDEDVYFTPYRFLKSSAYGHVLTLQDGWL